MLLHCSESDQQETDIEILTSSATEASANHDEGVWFSNQAVTDDTNASKEVVPYGFDPSAAFHEYRIDVSRSIRRLFDCKSL